MSAANAIVLKITFPEFFETVNFPDYETTVLKHSGSWFLFI